MFHVQKRFKDGTIRAMKPLKCTSAVKAEWIQRKQKLHAKNISNLAKPIKNNVKYQNKFKSKTIHVDSY